MSALHLRLRDHAVVEVALWVLALVLVRGLSIVALADVSFWGEELEKGAAAKAMLDGIGVAHHKLAYHYYEGGGFAVSHLKALLFLLVGESMLAQRLAGLCTCLLTFLAFWRLIDHHFGRRAARIGALLFLFGPASFQRYSLLSLGIHFEAMAFGLLVLDEGLRLSCERDREPGMRRLVGLGIVAGFALFFSYQNALIVGWAGLLFLIFRPRVLFSARGLASIAGFALGLTPLLLMAARVGNAVFDIHGKDLTAVGGGGARVVQLLGALYLDAPAADLVPRVLYPLAATLGILAAIAVANAPRRRAALGVLGFVVLWLVAWSSGTFVTTVVIGSFTWLRMAPLVLCAMVLGAAGVDAALARGGLVARGMGALLALVLLAGVLACGRIVAEGRPGTPLHNLAFLARTKGYDYRGYFPMLLNHLDSRRPEDLAALVRFEEPDPEFLWSSLAVALFENRRRRSDPLAQLRELEAIAPEGRHGFLLGLGASVLAHRKGDVTAALAQLEGMPAELGERLAEGLGYFPAHRTETRARLLEDLAAHGRGPLGQAYQRGLGMRAYRNLVMSTFGSELTMDEEGVRAFLAGQDPELAPQLLAGFEEERARWTLP